MGRATLADADVKQPRAGQHYRQFTLCVEGWMANAITLALCGLREEARSKR